MASVACGTPTPSSSYLSHARTVLKAMHEVAPAVVAGAIKLDAAYQDATRIRAEKAGSASRGEQRLDALRRRHADLVGPGR
jgi:hypothetical protein